MGMFDTQKFQWMDSRKQVRWLNEQLASARRNESRLLELLDIRSTVVGAVGTALAPEVGAAFDRIDEALKQLRSQ